MQTEIAEKIAVHVNRLSVEQQEEVLELVKRFDPPRESLWDVVKDLVAEIPDDVLEKLPPDGSINHDHYLYGARKK